MMRGIVLAAGSGTRMRPMTSAVNKHLMPVYDKPMLYYPLSVLMMAGIRDICVIVTPGECERVQALLGDGDWIGCRFAYRTQAAARGIADALHVAADFVCGDAFALILGDNIFHGHGFGDVLSAMRQRIDARDATHGQAEIFSVPVGNPSQYGIVERDANGQPTRIVEKPPQPASREAVPGFYFYPADALDRVRKLEPSGRGELEITDLNNAYLQDDRMTVTPLGRGYAWFDAGTPPDLVKAANFVQTIQDRQHLKIACLEEIAFRKGWISRQQLWEFSAKQTGTAYGSYLAALYEEDVAKVILS